MTLNTQTNIGQGDTRVTANETLTDKEGYLAKLVSNSGLKAALPDDANDLCLFVIATGGASAATVTLRPLYANAQVRLRLNGTCNPGDRLVPIADGTNDGKVAAIGSSADVVNVVAIAEEAGTDEMLVLARPCIQSGVIIPDTVDLDSTDATAGATGSISATSTDGVAAAANGITPQVADGAAAALTFSATVDQAEAEALRDVVEDLAEDIILLNTDVGSLAAETEKASDDARAVVTGHNGLAAETEKLSDDVRAIHAALVAAGIMTVTA